MGNPTPPPTFNDPNGAVVPVGDIVRQEEADALAARHAAANDLTIAGGGIPVKRTAGFNNIPGTPNFDPQAGGTVDNYGRPIDRPTEGFNYDHLTGFDPVRPPPDAASIASGIQAAMNEGSLSNADAALVGQFANQLLGGVQVSGSNGGFDLSAAGGRLAAVAQRQRLLLTKEAQSSANARLRAAFSTDRYDGFISAQEEYLMDVERHQLEEAELARDMNVFSLDNAEHKDFAVADAWKTIQGPNVPQWRKDAAEMFIENALGGALGDDGNGNPIFAEGTFTYAHIEALTKVSVGAAVLSWMDEMGLAGTGQSGEMQALEQMVQEGLLPAEVLTYEYSALSDDIPHLASQAVSGVALGSLGQLWTTPLYGDHAEEMQASVRKWMAIRPDGIDSLDSLGLTPAQYSVENIANLEEMRTAINQQFELSDLNELLMDAAGNRVTPQEFEELIPWDPNAYNREGMAPAPDDYVPFTGGPADNPNRILSQAELDERAERLSPDRPAPALSFDQIPYQGSN